MNWDKPVTDGAVPPLGATLMALAVPRGVGGGGCRMRDVETEQMTGVGRVCFFFVFFSRVVLT